MGSENSLKFCLIIFLKYLIHNRSYPFGRFILIVLNVNFLYNL